MSFKKSNVNKLILISCTFLFLYLWLLFIDQIQQGTTENIKEQSIIYSRELGWINLGHAIPDHPKKYFKAFQTIAKLKTDSFLFHFPMDMKIKLGDLEMVSQIEKSFLVPPCRSNDSIQQAYFAQIFASVSLGLEVLQGNYPFALLKGSEKSSFRKGDLTGNLLSIYLVFMSQELETLKEEISFLEVHETLNLNAKEKIDENKMRTYKEIRLDSIKLDKLQCHLLRIRTQMLEMNCKELKSIQRTFIQ